jgi:hypothetical protein
VTILAEESPYCGRSGRLCRVFWRQLAPWVLLRLSSSSMIAIPWGWTDLPIPASATDPSGDEPVALLSASALKDLLQFVRSWKQEKTKKKAL